MAKTTIPELIHMMVGLPPTDMFPKSPHPIGEALFSIQGAEGCPAQGRFPGTSPGRDFGHRFYRRDRDAPKPRASSSGLDPARGGSFVVTQKGYAQADQPPSPEALDLGLDLLSENRKEEGLAVGMSVGDNMDFSPQPVRGLGRFRLPEPGPENKRLKIDRGIVVCAARGRTKRSGTSRVGTSRRWPWRG